MAACIRLCCRLACGLTPTEICRSASSAANHQEHAMFMCKSGIIPYVHSQPGRCDLPMQMPCTIYDVGTAVALATPVPFIEPPLEHTHPGELVGMLVMGGPLVQKSVDVNASTVVLGLSSSGKNCALTRTGMIAPVPSENSL